MLGETSAIDEETPGSHSLLGRFNLDAPLLLGLLAVSVLGMVILYSAGRQDISMLLRQGVRLSIGFIVMIALAQLPPHHLRRWTPWIYLAGVGLLIVVLAAGAIGKGAQRWLDLGFVRFQPSEIMKIAVPMMVAWYFADKPLPPQLRHLTVGALLAAIPSLLIIEQPDLGTALLVGSSGAFALFLSGLSWRLILGVGTIAVIAAPLFWTFGMREYQQQRVLTFLDPESDPLGSGWNIIQSKIAIGSGGIFGKGWFHGTQAQLDFLPERSTDFIFAVFAEEFGLVGCIALLAVYMLIVCRCFYIAMQAQDTYSRLLASSLSVTFFIYIFVNIGMVIGVLPVVGVPLPLISYGGTSMVTLIAGFGILMSIQTHKKLLSN